MKCDDCGSATSVVDSRDSVRHRPDNTIEVTTRRRRQCAYCDVRFTTYEVRAERLKALESDEWTLTDLGKRLGRPG